jgi:hypothetical protein
VQFHTRPVGQRDNGVEDVESLVRQERE